MKYTAELIKVNKDRHRGWTMLGKITCVCTGELDDGGKVWTGIEDGEQYMLFRLGGRPYFCHM